MLEKYDKFPKHHRQQILLEIAFIYWITDGKIGEALKYFLMAIEIDSTADCLKVYCMKFFFFFFNIRIDNKNNFYFRIFILNLQN